MERARLGRVVRHGLAGAAIHAGAVFGALVVWHGLLRDCLPDECEPPNYFAANFFYVVTMLVAYPLGCVGLVLAVARSFDAEVSQLRARAAGSFGIVVASLILVGFFVARPFGFSAAWWQVLVIGAPVVATTCAAWWVSRKETASQRVLAPDGAATPG